jgi:hypothetical protein
MGRHSHATRQIAARLYTQWRGEGVPARVTGHEAHRLSGGAAGTEGDHATPHALAAVALATAVAVRRTRAG